MDNGIFFGGQLQKWSGAETGTSHTFMKNKCSCHEHLQLDNTTAVEYINHKGGTPSLQLRQIAKTLQRWCPRASNPDLGKSSPGIAIPKQTSYPDSFQIVATGCSIQQFSKLSTSSGAHLRWMDLFPSYPHNS